jgi:hypothetical protein
LDASESIQVTLGRLEHPEDGKEPNVHWTLNAECPLDNKKTSIGHFSECLIDVFYMCQAVKKMLSMVKTWASMVVDGPKNTMECSTISEKT